MGQWVYGIQVFISSAAASSVQHLSVTPGKADGEFGAIPELCMIFASCSSGNMLFKLILILGVFKF